MSGYLAFTLCLFILALIGGYLATAKKSQQQEDFGQRLVMVCGTFLCIVPSMPGVTFSRYEIVGLALSLISGSLTGVWLWDDRRPLAQAIKIDRSMGPG